MRLHSVLFLIVPIGLTQAQQPQQDPTKYENQGVFGRHWSGILVDADCTPAGGRQVAGIISPDMQSTQTKPSSNADRGATPESRSDADRAARPESQGEANRTTEPERNPDLATTTSRESNKNSKPEPAPTQAQWRSCPATSATTHFGIVLPDGRLLRFDAGGNSLVGGRASQGRLIPAAGGSPNVRVAGTLVGDTLEVKTIR
jgi:hypothetical protein